MFARTMSSSAVSSTSEGGGPPSVFDSVVTLTFVDPSGARRKVAGLIGEFVLAPIRRCCRLGGF